MPPDSAPAQVPDLETLARAHFEDLTEAELKLLRAAPKGEVAVCGPNDDDEHPANDPAKAGEWGPDRQIRAGLIRWLCVDRDAKEQVDPMGIQAHGAKITGALDLSFAIVPFPFALWRCRLMDDANFYDVEIPGIDLQGTWVSSISADGARVKGNVFLHDGFRAEGAVRLLGAQIGGQLSCSGGTFTNPPQEGMDASGDALFADGAVVNGGVFLNKGFRADGEVRLLNAQIEGNLECDSSTFVNPPQAEMNASGKALSADRAVVKGDVFLNKGFRADGAVRLLGAQIGGNLACSGGTFTNPPKQGMDASGIALFADGAVVKGDVFLSEGFRAEGAVRFLGIQIAGDLECTRGTFNGQFLAATAAIKGPFLWDSIAHPEHSILNLTNASVDALVDDAPSWPAPGNLILDGFVYARISGNSPKGAKNRLDWLARQKDFRPQPYRQLAKVLREDGDEDGRRRVLVEMERRQRAPSWTGQPLSWLLRWTIGYGHYPGRALWWLLGLVLAGFLLFSGGYFAGSVTPTDKDAYACFKKGGQLPPHYETFHASIYSLENSFPFVKLGQADRWQPDPDPHWQHRPIGRAPPWFRLVLPPGRPCLRPQGISSLEPQTSRTSKSFAIHCYEKRACKPFGIRSYAIVGLKVPWNEYLQKKEGRGSARCAQISTAPGFGHRTRSAGECVNLKGSEAPLIPGAATD